MKKTRISRRKAFAISAAGSGMILGAGVPSVEAWSLKKTWGEDFLTPWSPDPTLKRDLKPGNSPIRLSCAIYALHFEKGKNIGEMVRKVREKGYTAAESSDSWNEASDSDIRELHAALKQHDVLFYAMHLALNNIHPDLEIRQKNLKRVARMVETADRLGLSFVVSHTGSCDPSPVNPHRDNWTRETWETSVKSIRQILKDTSGSKVNLGMEAVNFCNLNNPRAHVQFRQDVGDPRVKVTLDPTNMMNPSVYYRSTELIEECFGLLGEDIMYAHAKDVLLSPEMLPVIKWVVPGTGTMDYETYLVQLSRMKKSRALMIEFLSEEQSPLAKKFIEDTAARIGVKIYK
jgi:sugar phosphate isomerase/epimerase